MNMIRKIRTDVWLCSECLMIAVNGDASGLDYSYLPDDAAERLADIEAGLDRLGAHLVPDFDSETGEGCEEEIGAYCTRRACDCCQDYHHGSRHRFAILGQHESELDQRYTISLEHTGAALPRWVVRFCDTWVGCETTNDDALALRNRHYEGRMAILTGAA